VAGTFFVIRSAAIARLQALTNGLLTPGSDISAKRWCDVIDICYRTNNNPPWSRGSVRCKHARLLSLGRYNQ